MNFFTTLASWPTVIYTVLLGVVLAYWLLALVGMVDVENGGDWATGVDFDFDADGATPDVGTLASWLVAFGLNGVPFSIVISLLALMGWCLCGMASLTLLPLVPGGALLLLAKAGILLAAAALSVIISAQLVRPMRRLFVTHAAISNAALVGQTCKVLTGVVDDRQGRAEVAQRGASINIRVWSPAPNGFRRGDTALITEYDAAAQRYRIDPVP